MLPSRNLWHIKVVHLLCSLHQLYCNTAHCCSLPLLISAHYQCCSSFLFINHIRNPAGHCQVIIQLLQGSALVHYISLLLLSLIHGIFYQACKCLLLYKWTVCNGWRGLDLRLFMCINALHRLYPCVKSSSIFTASSLIHRFVHQLMSWTCQICCSRICSHFWFCH